MNKQDKPLEGEDFDKFSHDIQQITIDYALKLLENLPVEKAIKALREKKV